MRIIRVFPRRTKLTPRDAFAFVGDPPMENVRPAADEVHVSCAFTWDKSEAERLVKAWGQYYQTVKLGGPAYGSTLTRLTTALTRFTPGKYIAPGVTFTSRGCNNQCPWCLVPPREGRLKAELDFAPGHIINDNNLLQCPREHVERVFEMLRYQGRAITFTGGIDARLVRDWFVEELRTITVDQIFLACDTREAVAPLRRAVKLIGLPQDKVRCYVLLKFRENETISEATARLEDVWNAGTKPFAILYQPADKWIEYPKEWKALATTWARPAATFAAMASRQ